MKKTWNRKIS